jgi:AcrR family transcriptional regulator
MRGRPQSISAETILDAAAAVFRESGRAATTAEIATRAGVSEGILFHRYKNKETLLAAVIQREGEPPLVLREMLARAGRGSLTANLRTITETVLDHVLRLYPLFELGMSSAKPAAFHASMMAAVEKPAPVRVAELISRYLQAEASAGRIRQVDSMCVARAMMGATVELAHSQRWFGSNMDRNAFARGMVDFVLHGIAASESPGK